MKKIVLVTGASGFIGQALCGRLLDQGHTVLGLDLRIKPIAHLISRGLIEIKGDVRSGFECSPDVTHVYHLAAINNPTDFQDRPFDVLECAVKGAINAAKFAKESSAKLIMFSSAEVYHEPSVLPTPEDVPLKIPSVSSPRAAYAASKIASEVAALHAGLDTAIVVRPHNVFGPNMPLGTVISDLANKLIRAKAWNHLARVSSPIPLGIAGDGSQTRSFIHVEDFLDALDCVEASGKSGIYNIGTDDTISIRSLAQHIAGTLGVEIEIQPGAAPETAQNRCPDLTKLKALGWKGPAKSFVVRLDETLSAFTQVVLERLNAR